MCRIREAKEKGEELPYHFIEVMACRGGCVAGGGQPRVIGSGYAKPWGITDKIRKQRAAGLLNEDLNAKTRLSHHNESVKTLYKEYLGEPGGENAHHLLHTKYVARD